MDAYASPDLSHRFPPPLTPMEQLVIPSRQEQEYLLHALDSVLPLADMRQFFQWARDQLQPLLPHRVMVCLRLDADGAIGQLQCVHGAVLAPAERRLLCDPEQGLAARLVRLCQAGLSLPAMLDADAAPGAAASAELLPCLSELRRLGLGNLLLHGSGPLPGGATYVLLFGLPQRPGPRHAHFFRLLLPSLHMTLQRLGQQGGCPPAPAARPMSARETEVLHWLGQGKSNLEIGQILGISGLTVKNHLQRLYRVLGVSNRTHAVSRCAALGLLAAPAMRPPRPAGRTLGATIG